MSSPSKLSRRASRSSKARGAAIAPLRGSKDTHDHEHLSSSLSDAEPSHSHLLCGLLDLDDTMQCAFQTDERVWVKPKNTSEWVQGVVSGVGRQGTTREGDGMLYPVRYNHTKRDYFAPQNGDLKPDTQEVRALLVAGGWLQDP